VAFQIRRIPVVRLLSLFLPAGVGHSGYCGDWIYRDVGICIILTGFSLLPREFLSLRERSSYSGRYTLLLLSVALLSIAIKTSKSLIKNNIIIASVISAIFGGYSIAFFVADYYRAATCCHGGYRVCVADYSSHVMT